MNSHGILKIDVEDDEWTAEVGQPWRNKRAGLEDGDLAERVETRVNGEPAADVSEERIKVERLFVRKGVELPRLCGALHSGGSSTLRLGQGSMKPLGQRHRYRASKNWSSVP